MPQMLVFVQMTSPAKGSTAVASAPAHASGGLADRMGGLVDGGAVYAARVCRSVCASHIACLASLRLEHFSSK